MTTDQQPSTGHNSSTFGEVLEKNPEIIFTDPTALPALVAYLENEIVAHVPDLTTSKGRSAITKLASNIVSHKTMLDGLGKKLNEDARKQIDEIDAVRRDIRTSLDRLRDRAREPLTKWELAEQVRTGKIEKARLLIDEAMRLTRSHPRSQVQSFHDTLCELQIDRDVFEDLTDAVGADRQSALIHLFETRKQIDQDDRDRAELAELRAQRDREAEAERRAAAQKAEEERERQRQEAAKVAAQKAAELAAQRAAEAERRAAQAVIDEANRKARELEATLIRERAAAEQKARDEENARLDAQMAEAERQRDLEHRSKVIKESLSAIMAAGNIHPDDWEVARSIIDAIIEGKIPHVTFRF